jgi:hypothetical protein
MIDVGNAKPSSVNVEVTPSNNIFRELGNNTYTFLDLLSELIDNCVAARESDGLLDVQITIGVCNQREKSFFAISDNATGIPRGRLGAAISPAAIQNKDSLNEHGLGMKQAVASLGDLEYLATKTKKDKLAIVISKFQFGKLDPKEVAVPWEQGTEIRVVRLREIVPMTQTHYTRDIVRQLGARYRRLLLPDAPQMRLSLKLVDADSSSVDLIQEYRIEPVKPVYFHPKTRQNKPVEEKKIFKGHGWKAVLTFGYAPTDKEYVELGLEKPTKFDPYHVSIRNQGFDILLHDRVIEFHMLSELGLIQARHNDYNIIRGEIDLTSGFSTAITKNAIIQDEHLREAIDQIKEFLDGNGYLQRKTYPGDLSEELLRDRLAEWLRTNRVHPRKDVQTEFAIQGLGGSIDIIADDEVWELKKDEADGLDVYQLFAYLDMGNFEKGVLVAKGFSTGANMAAEHIQKKHKKQITLAPLSEFAVNHPMNDKERQDYS